MGGRKCQVAVVGGGIGGATLALMLARQGVNVAVLEQAPVWRPLYKGEYLQPRSLAIFDDLGLATAIRAVTQPVYYSRVGMESGEMLIEMDLRDLGQFEGRNGHHRDIQGAVLQALNALPDVSLHMGVRVTGLQRDPNGWQLETSAGPWTAAAVVGADGRKSTVRRLLGIPAAERPYPGAALAVTVQLDDDPPPRVDQMLGDRDSAYFFPLPQRQARLYLLLHTDADAARFRALPDGGLDHLRRRLTAYFPHLATGIAGIASMDEVQAIPSYLLMAQRWVADGAALLGDAAHCVNPARGQGMNLAIADALALADVLSAGLAADRLGAADLAEYERQRRTQAEYIQREGDRTRWLFLSPNPLVRWLRRRTLRNSPRAQRAMRRLMGTLTGLQPPPSPLVDLLLGAAFAFPALDPLVPDP